MKNIVQQFTEQYNLYKEDKVQQIQLQHRFSLCEAFQIKEGMHILEIGCGQGDTTMALAHVVGPTGHVTAIDVASGDYGSPLTLAQAHEKIKKTDLGKRISFHLQTNYEEFPQNQYDAIVLSHCSWYFQEISQLKRYFEKMKNETNTIFLAEWDLNFQKMTQRNHFVAVTLIALYSTFVQNDSNIQHVIGQSTFEEMIASINFSIEATVNVDATYLQDGLWERYYAKSLLNKFDQAPSTINQYVKSLAPLLDEKLGSDSLNSIVFICKKKEE